MRYKLIRSARDISKRLKKSQQIRATLKFKANSIHHVK